MTPFKLPNAAAYKISVTATAANLLDLINTAAGQTVAFPYSLSVVEITPEDGDVRYTDNGLVPTATNGNLIAVTEVKTIETAPVDVKLISVIGTVTCNVRVGWHHRSN